MTFDKVDLAALVRSRGVELKAHGRRDLIGRCRFHEESKIVAWLIIEESLDAHH